MREDGGEGAWETVVSEEEEREEGDKDDEQHLNPNSAEAIRKRLQRFQKRLAKRKEKTDKQEQSNDNSKGTIHDTTRDTTRHDTSNLLNLYIRRSQVQGDHLAGVRPIPHHLHRPAGQENRYVLLLMYII
jgi:hypothetical protein